MRSWNLIFLLLVLSLLFSLPVPYSKAKDLKITGGQEAVDIEADELIYEQERDLYHAHGQVDVTRGDFSLKADHAQIHLATKDLTAWGNVILREGEDVVECERLEVNLNSRLGKIYRAKLFLKEQNFHIIGQEAEKLGENEYRIREASFTTCDGDHPPWKFTAKELEVTVKGFGIAKDSVFYVENVPVLYSPWGVFPVKRERQTGILMPEVGYSDQFGPQIKTAFYWAMAKDMDSTFNLNYLGDRGFQEGLEYRYAFTEDTRGQAHFYFIDDQEFNGNRYAYFVEHQQKFPYDFYLKGDINRVSDNQYPRDFDQDLPTGTSLDARSLRLMRSVLFGGKNWDQFNFLVDAEVFDDLTIPSNDRTLQTLPKASFFALPQSLFKTPFFYEMSTSYDNFWRETGVEAQRGDIFPIVSYPTRLFDVLKVSPSFGVRETLYYSYNDPTGISNGWQSRETFETGFQSSVEFYRVYDAEPSSKISNLFKVVKWMHTIEPSVGYSYTPRVDQKDLPVFDDVDRIPYLSEINYGITQRLVGRPEKETMTSGSYEYARLTISQRYSLGDPYVDSEGEKRWFSNIRSELWFSLNPYLSAEWDIEFNPYRAGFDLSNFLIRGKDRRDDVLQIQYLYTKDRNQGINLDARVKTISPLYIFGSYRYDLSNHWRVASIYGAEYQAQCWSLGFAVENWNQSPTGTQQKEVKVQLYVNLLNLGALGHKPYQMLY